MESFYAGKFLYSVIPNVTVIPEDWISENLLQNRCSFIAPINPDVTVGVPVVRANWTHPDGGSFKYATANEDACMVCGAVYEIDGKRCGRIDCGIRTANYQVDSDPGLIQPNVVYKIKGLDEGGGVSVTRANDGIGYYIIDADSAANTITYINA